jgi:hypothetical protein
VRDINDILHFRSDLSPFLVHLTKAAEKRSAKEILKAILKEGGLKPGTAPVSDVRFGGRTKDMEEEKGDYFGALCFTETPLNEAHCLLEIKRRKINLEPYGLAFLKENLRNKGVTPVYYLNNENSDKDEVAKALFSLIKTHPDAAKELLPLFSVFGKYLVAPGAERKEQNESIGFLWEREWRYPASKGELKFSNEDVFVGLCPHSDINYFEKIFKPLKFIDPRYNMKWYATKLIDARQRLDMKHSVI